MSRGYRFLIAAAGGLALFVALGTGAFFGALYAPHYSDEATRSAYKRSDAEQHRPSQIDRDRAGLPYFAERIAAGPDPENGNEGEKRDLAAQESMSVWAFWALIVAAGSLFITGIGTGFLLWQIILTRRAVEDTGEATEAMREANEITRNGQTAELRPWLVIDDLKIDPIKIAKNMETDTLHIAVEGVFFVKNVGKTPAESFKSFVKVLSPSDAIKVDSSISTKDAFKGNFWSILEDTIAPEEIRKVSFTFIKPVTELMETSGHFCCEFLCAYASSVKTGILETRCVWVVGKRVRTRSTRAWDASEIVWKNELVAETGIRQVYKMT